MKSQIPQLVVTVALIGLFGAAFFSDRSDEMMKGALIGAFSAAYGYWLGSSSGSKSNGDTIRRMAEAPSVTATGDHPTINSPGVEVKPEKASADDPAMFGGPRP